MPWAENMPLTLAKYMQALIRQPRWICVTKRIKPKASRLYPEITDSTGKKNTDTEGVAEAFASHYETLYSCLMDQHFDDGTKKYIDTNISEITELFKGDLRTLQGERPLQMK